MFDDAPPSQSGIARLWAIIRCMSVVIFTLLFVTIVTLGAIEIYHHMKIDANPALRAPTLPQPAKPADSKRQGSRRSRASRGVCRADHQYSRRLKRRWTANGAVTLRVR